MQLWPKQQSKVLASLIHSDGKLSGNHEYKKKLINIQKSHFTAENNEEYNTMPRC